MVLSPGYLTQDQHTVVAHPLDARIFLSGPAGTGKTTSGVERILYLLEHGVPGNQILLLVPQRSLAGPYYAALQAPTTVASSMVNVLTIGGMARRMVELFWPLVASEAGFAYPDRPPIFLTLETAQYYMAHIVRPLLSEGYFDSITLDRNRLYSQILDNLSKAAVHGFSHSEIEERLKAAWVGDPGQAHVYADAQDCVDKFRQYCLDHNLLDFSLQLEVFLQQLWPYPITREYLYDIYHHLICDNLEEATPVTSDLLQDWLPHFDSALLIFDTDGGYRRFLGADPESSRPLSEMCEVHTRFVNSFISSNHIATFNSALTHAIKHPNAFPTVMSAENAGSYIVGDTDGWRSALHYPESPIRFYHDMLDWVAEEIAVLIEKGTPPGEIVILSPYLPDSLRYSMVDRLNRLGIPSRSHRPSRALREEPATHCLLTLAKLAHPDWNLVPQNSDVAYALMQAIADLDLVRAQLLNRIVYRKGSLSSFEVIKPEVQERITYVLGGRYDHLRLWLENYKQGVTWDLDHFLSRLFGEILSQPGYSFHGDFNAGTIAANLIESVGKFRRVAGEVLAAEGISLGKEYLLMVEDGVIAAQYLLPWLADPGDAVFLAPAYTFLMANRSVDYQFWLDVGGRGWYERLYQPLTHPFVLSNRWPVGQPWTDIIEIETARDSLYRLTIGLLRRCRQGIFLGLSDLSEGGYEHKGELLRAINRALRGSSFHD